MTCVGCMCVQLTVAEWSIAVELPGMKPEDVTVDFDPHNNCVNISGERKHEKTEEKEGRSGRKYTRTERSYGRCVCWVFF